MTCSFVGAGVFKLSSRVTIRTFVPAREGSILSGFSMACDGKASIRATVVEQRSFESVHAKIDKKVF